MTVLQVGGLFDGTVFGVPVLIALLFGGVVALLAGALARAKVEGIPLSVASGLIRKSSVIQRLRPDPDVVETPSVADSSSGSPATEPAGESNATPATRTPDEPEAESTEPESTAARDEAGEQLRLPELVETAVSRYENGEFDGAVQAAYMFARVRLADELQTSTDGTHWTFFERCVDAGVTDRENPLRELTELFEQAAFGSQPMSREEAKRGMALTEQLTDVTVPEID